MTSNAVDIGGIYLALRSHYAGMSINVGTPAVSTPVTVFLEDPATELVPERIYPSLSITLLSWNEDTEVSESSDDEYEELSYDDTPEVHERVMRQKPLPHRVQFSIDTWHKVRTKEELDLVQIAVLQRTKPRGYLTVATIDSENVDCWMLQQGSVVQRNEHMSDMVILHKIVTVEVLAHLSSVSFDDTIREKVVMKANWEAVNQYLLTQDSGDEILPAKDVTDLIFEFDDVTEGTV